MLDPRFVAENPEMVKDHLRRRHPAPEMLAAVDTIVECGSKRSALIGERDHLLNRRNVLSREIGQLMREGKKDDAEAKKAEVAAGNERVPRIEDELAAVEKLQTDLIMGIPNLLHKDVPDGETEDDNPVVRTWGKIPRFDFPPQAHVEIGEKLGIMDLERAAKLTGARFSVLKGAGARLERALINFFLDVHTEQHGYTELMVPYMVHRRIMEGTGQLPKFEADMFKLDRPVNGEDTFLVPTAEVPVTNLHREEILAQAELPKKFVAFTPCFRAEAGSAGRDVRGLIRQHQFHKVELVWITTPDQADANHEQLVSDAEDILKRLKLPYRVVLHCAGELSANATKCYDLEVWLPSQDKFREISSVSNFGEYQARRMQLRWYQEVEGAKKPKPRLCATLNGSGLAVGRTLVAILENYQQADGSVVIPEALRPYMGGLEVIEAPTGA